MSALAVAIRWLHVVPAVIAGGASVFAAVAVLPTLAELPEQDRKAARERIAARWRVVVMICITLLLVSGLASFVLYQGPAHKGQPLYQALFGLKFVAALGVFFIASALTGRSASLQPMRDNARFWARLNAALVVAIVLIAGLLRGIPAAP